MHTMTLMRKHEGIEEWLCPICGRHMLVNWQPKFKRTILSAGDLSASHNGFKSEIQPGSLADGSSKPEEIHLPPDESRLTPWANWMDKSDFGKRWNNDIQ